MSSLEVLEYSRAKHKVKDGKYWEGEPMEETRQQYANAGIERFLLWHAPRRAIPFAEILEAFRQYGRLYDMGWRLHDGEEGAA